MYLVGIAAPKKSARQTKTFPTEDDAKQFAKEMLSEKHHIFAGTLLGVHLPLRRFISGSQLHGWAGVKKSDLDLT